MDNPVADHDALEFPDGQVVLVTRLCDGQRATVLQLPAGARTTTAEGTVVEPQLRESPFRSNRADEYALIDGAPARAGGGCLCWLGRSSAPLTARPD